MNRVKIAIFFSLVVLVGLIVISIFLSQSGGKNNLTKDVIKPVIEETKTDPSKLLNETKNLPILTEEDADKNFQLQDKIPYISQDFELGYSDLTGKYYVYKKTPKADAQLNKFFSDFKPSNLNVVNKNVAQAINEEELKIIDFNSSIEKESISKSDNTQDYEKVKEENRKNNLQVLSKLFTQLFSPSTGGTDQLSDFLSNEDGEATPNLEVLIPSVETNLTLDGIFNEAGIKIGTPPKILRGVMSRECPPLINLPNEKIIEYSKPGNGIPPTHGCYRNSIGVMGPMQFFPGLWSDYGRAVNRFGDYTHNPYIENIRDAVYGAAWKLKRDSRTTDLNWTYDQVRRAVVCYNAGCGRLNNPPSSTLRYLEAVWNIYKS